MIDIHESNIEICHLRPAEPVNDNKSEVLTLQWFLGIECLMHTTEYKDRKMLFYSLHQL